MNRKSKVNLHWLREAFILLAFVGFLSTKNARGIGLPPVINVPPLGATVHNGDTVTFTCVIAASITPITFQWCLDGTELKSAVVSTNKDLLGVITTTLTIKNASQSRGGNYSIKVQNGNGQVVSPDALLVVLNGTIGVVTNVSILTSQCGMTNGGFQLNFLKPATSNCVLDASTDLRNWTPIYTNTSGSTNFSYLDSAATNLPGRYYRVRMR